MIRWLAVDWRIKAVLVGLMTYGFHIYIQLVLRTKPEIALSRLPHVSHPFILLSWITFVILTLVCFFMQISESLESLVFVIFYIIFCREHFSFLESNCLVDWDCLWTDIVELSNEHKLTQCLITKQPIWLWWGCFWLDNNSVITADWFTVASLQSVRSSNLMAV